MASKVLITYPGAADRLVFDTPEVLARYVAAGWTVASDAVEGTGGDDAVVEADEAIPDPFAMADDHDQHEE